MEMMMDSISNLSCSLVEIIFVVIIVNTLNIVFQEFYFSFRSMLLFFLYAFSLFRKIWVATRNRAVVAFPATWKLFIHKILPDESPAQVEQVSKKLEEKPCIFRNLDGDDQKLSLEEVKMTMEKLITLEETSNTSKIGPLFEEEVSMEEVKEAFGLFDENKDGFIDATELRHVLCTLTFPQASEAECKKMISAFDDNRDGRIDFNEFVKILECSFS